MKSILVLPATLAAALLTGSLAEATPYASALNNNAGTVSFILNEAADDVKIISGGVTNSLGTQAAGPVTANVGAVNPFSVQVIKNSGAGYKTAVSNFSGTISWAGKIQISSDPTLARFPNPRGVAVNKNPASPYFGRIFVANSTPASTTVGARSVGRGLYSLNPDFSDSPNGYGDTAQTAGLFFATSANSPLRLSVGPDDYIYIADYSDANGNVYRCDGNLQNGQQLLDVVGGSSPLPSDRTHGSTLKAIVEGSSANGNLTLYTIDEDLGQTTTTPQNDLWRYDLGSGPFPSAAVPTKLSSVLIKAALVDDFCKGGPNNYLYLLQNRSATTGTPTPSLYIVDSTGTTVANGLQLWRDFTGNPAADNVLTNCHSIAISADGKYLAFMLLSASAGAGTSKAFVLPLDSSGLPNFSGLKLLDSGTVTQGRGIDFDAAGNLYTLSSGDQLLRSFSPGGYTIATTTSDGTFNIFTPGSTITVAASGNSVTEGSTIDLTFTRAGGDTSGALTVNYNLNGTATNGADYSLPGSVTFAAGETTTNVTVAATDDSVAELTETVIATLVSSPSYDLGSPFAATVSILDNETPEFSISTVSSNMYERLPHDYVAYRLTRKGNVNVTLSVNISYSGTADSSRYSGSATVGIQAGEATADLKIFPVNDSLLNGDQTIIATVAAGDGYAPAAPASATGTIVDDEYPTENPLFSDGLADGAGSSQWTQLFGANNLIDDYSVNWGYNLGDDGVPAAPAGSTTALKVSVNKQESTAGGAAGINFYPTNRTFSGDFALRFDMLLMQNTSANTTEYALFGINHSGAKTNWVLQSAALNAPRNCDGIFFAISADGSASAPGDFVALTGTNAANVATVLRSVTAASQAQNFKKPPYSAVSAGAPANILTSSTMSWADVEVKQIGNVVTLSINKFAVLQITNTTPHTSGNIMLGYMDPYDSFVGSVGGAAYYSNVRVVNLNTAPPSLSIGRSGGSITLTWSGGATLQHATALTGSPSDWSDVSGATSPYTTSSSSGVKFYRLRQ